ncbi:hypothetical protein SEA_ZIKO_7 [Gordonia phage Ziko]|uniref:Uncharacterized protein n=1 Tax=Gordonia phage Ziko TaxID=2591193 RepID=A0A514A5E6_9CAUD|nr:hypothetical protein SEA_ZIKO_7 [Gordonia phage Ziko]
MIAISSKKATAIVGRSVQIDVPLQRGFQRAGTRLPLPPLLRGAIRNHLEMPLWPKVVAAIRYMGRHSVA